MRRLLVVPALALVILSPTVAQADPGDLVVCNDPPAGTVVIAPNETKTPTVASPQYDVMDYTYTDVQFQLDLYPATATDTADVTATLDWDLDVNDWDLLLLDQDGTELKASENFQFGPLFDPPGESVSDELLHCSLFTVSVMNVQAIALDDVDPLRLQVRSGSVANAASWL
jgi:hypothetical protein